MTKHSQNGFRIERLAVALVVALGLAFACSESPTDATVDGKPPLFKPKDGCDPWPSCNNDPSPPATLKADLVDQSPGVTGDGDPEPYTGEHVTDRFRLQPQCEARTMSLVGVDLSPLDVSASLANQSECNGGADDGWVFLMVPDLLDTADCDSADAVEENDCAFELLPSFEVKGNKGVLKATGGFAPTAHYFEQDLETGQRLDFVFQDAKVVTNMDGSKTFTAGEAHLYVGHGFVCVGRPGETDPETNPENIGLCADVELSVNITVTP